MNKIHLKFEKFFVFFDEAIAELKKNDNYGIPSIEFVIYTNDSAVMTSFKYKNYVVLVNPYYEHLMGSNTFMVIYNNFYPTATNEKLLADRIKSRFINKGKIIKL